MFSRPFSFNGRIGRLEFFLSLMVYYGLTFVAAILSETVGFEDYFYLALIPGAWLFLAQGAKRCHDLGNSGFFQLIPFYIFWMLFAEGQRGNNGYGAPNGKVENNETLDSVLEP